MKTFFESINDRLAELSRQMEAADSSNRSSIWLAISKTKDNVMAELSIVQPGTPIKCLCYVPDTDQNEWCEGKYIGWRSALDKEIRIDVECYHPKYGWTEITEAAPECVKLIISNI